AARGVGEVEAVEAELREVALHGGRDVHRVVHRGDDEDGRARGDGRGAHDGAAAPRGEAREGGGRRGADEHHVGPAREVEVRYGRRGVAWTEAGDDGRVGEGFEGERAHEAERVAGRGDAHLEAAGLEQHDEVGHEGGGDGAGDAEDDVRAAGGGGQR